MFASTVRTLDILFLGQTRHRLRHPLLLVAQLLSGKGIVQLRRHQSLQYVQPDGVKIHHHHPGWKNGFLSVRNWDVLCSNCAFPILQLASYFGMQSEHWKIFSDKNILWYLKLDSLTIQFGDGKTKCTATPMPRKNGATCGYYTTPMNLTRVRCWRQPWQPW